MLVLTRKLNQSITLGDNVRVTVLSIDGDRVSIGVDAPRDVRVFRSELIDGTRQANQESQVSAMSVLKDLKKDLKKKGAAAGESPAEAKEEKGDEAKE
ncbi:MAG: carbon storage regulator CsrA [Oscillospiraceae bacterium]|jgi:carbon storage regulator|nr:carbon storage regulator CsrA [Oscillospiraceae bacterium]